MGHLTLDDVIAERSLGLRLVTPDAPAALRRPVVGAHGTEALHPVPWVRRDWLLLITGVRLVDRPDRQRELVAELAESGIAALGFGVGIDFDHVPGPLQEAAAERDFPVFEIPLRTPFHQIVASVNRGLLGHDLHDLHVMRRLTSMREFLLDALRGDEPQALVVQRLASLLDCSVALLAPEGRTEAVAGRVPSDEALRRAARTARDGTPAELDGRAVLVAPVAVGDVAQSTLVVLVGRGSPATYVRPLLDSAAMLLGGLAGLRRVTRALARGTHEAFLAELLDPAPSADAAWAHRAAALGLDRDEPYRGVAVADDGSRAGPGPRETLEAAELLLADAGRPTVLAVRDGGVTGIVQGTEEDLRPPLEALADRLGSVVVAVGRPAASMGDVRASLADTAVMLRAAPASPPRSGAQTRWFEALGLVPWMLATAEQGALRLKAGELLDRLGHDDVASASLDAYFRHDLNVVRAARTLSLHPNSLRYRLSRIEQRLGGSLSDPDVLAAVLLARRVAAPVRPAATHGAAGG